VEQASVLQIMLLFAGVVIGSIAIGVLSKLGAAGLNNAASKSTWTPE
jgi:hypothetical protein